MCGSEVDSELFKTDIEGSVLNVCAKCSKYGSVISRVKSVPEVGRMSKKEGEHKGTVSAKPIDQEGEIVFVIAADYAEKIKRGREKLGLKQDELAKRLNERDSLISKIETGTIEPNMRLARKLEKFFGIKLVEEHKEDNKAVSKDKQGPVTIGDLARLRKR